MRVHWTEPPCLMTEACGCHPPPFLKQARTQECAGMCRAGRLVGRRGRVGTPVPGVPGRSAGAFWHWSCALGSPELVLDTQTQAARVRRCLSVCASPCQVLARSWETCWGPERCCPGPAAWSSGLRSGTCRLGGSSFRPAAEPRLPLPDRGCFGTGLKREARPC